MIKRRDIPALSASNKARFWSKVDRRGPDECWPWTGSLGSKGYGTIKIQRLRYRASRVSYVIHNSKSPGDYMVCHSCDNPPCVNPAHLWLGTNADNMADAKRKGRFHGVERRGEGNPNAKLTAEIVRLIRANPDGLSNTEMARRLGVATATVFFAKKGVTWGDA